ncbi:MAG: hypothetical protein AVDCRST_MAG66-3911, partial [uncultured Pseudonocardia sp.]
GRVRRGTGRVRGTADPAGGAAHQRRDGTVPGLHPDQPERGGAPVPDPLSRHQGPAPAGEQARRDGAAQAGAGPGAV